MQVMFHDRFRHENLGLDQRSHNGSSAAPSSARVSGRGVVGRASALAMRHLCPRAGTHATSIQMIGKVFRSLRGRLHVLQPQYTTHSLVVVSVGYETSATAFLGILNFPSLCCIAGGHAVL